MNHGKAISSVAFQLHSLCGKNFLSLLLSAFLSTGADSCMQCCICQEKCVNPVRLPCHHTFCYLCIKGVAVRNCKCALCMQKSNSTRIPRKNLQLWTKMKSSLLWSSLLLHTAGSMSQRWKMVDVRASNFCRYRECVYGTQEKSKDSDIWFLLCGRLWKNGAIQGRNSKSAKKDQTGHS